MATLIQPKIKRKSSNATGQLLNEVLHEIRSLRREFSLILPQEDLEDYVHPEQIKRSYEKALKKFPPARI